jgi:hypothetical protein
MPGALEHMIDEYNFQYVPQYYFDGGQSVGVGWLAQPTVKSRIQTTGTRTTFDLYLQVSVEFVSSTKLNIHYEVASRQNQAPSVASQPTTGCAMNLNGANIAFATQATEPDGDQIYYRWAFGNDDSSTWVGPYNSGEACMINYTYSAPGSYNVSILTKDPWLVGSVWSTPKTIMVSGCSCGDANDDGGVDISDAVFLIAYIFSGGAAPGPCTCSGTGNEMGDANGDGTVDISDAVYLISYIFSGGAAPHCQ